MNKAHIYELWAELNIVTQNQLFVISTSSCQPVQHKNIVASHFYSDIC